MPAPMGFLRVTNRRSGAALGDRIKRASSVAARVRGLIGSAPLESGEGLWIEPCSSIHMWFMSYAIDVVFIDAHHCVTRAREAVRPWGLALGGSGARTALELPVGAIAASGTRRGDELEVVEGR